MVLSKRIISLLAVCFVLTGCSLFRPAFKAQNPKPTAPASASASASTSKEKFIMYNSQGFYPPSVLVKATEGFVIYNQAGSAVSFVVSPNKPSKTIKPFSLKPINPKALSPKIFLDEPGSYTIRSDLNPKYTTTVVVR